MSHPKRHAGLTEEGQPFLKDKVPLSVHTCSPHCVPFPHTPVSWLTDHGSQNVTPPRATCASTKSNGLTQLLIVDKALCDLAPRLQGRQRSEAWQLKNTCRICLCQQLSVCINSARLQKGKNYTDEWYFLPIWLIWLVGFFPGLEAIYIFKGLLHSSSNASTDKTNISEKRAGIRGYRVKFPHAFGLQCMDAITPAYIYPDMAFHFTGECLLQLFRLLNCKYIRKYFPSHKCGRIEKFSCLGAPAYWESFIR